MLYNVDIALVQRRCVEIHPFFSPVLDKVVSGLDHQHCILFVGRDQERVIHIQYAVASCGIFAFPEVLQYRNNSAVLQHHTASLDVFRGTLLHSHLSRSAPTSYCSESPSSALPRNTSHTTPQMPGRSSARPLSTQQATCPSGPYQFSHWSSNCI